MLEVENFISEWHLYAGTGMDSNEGMELNSDVDTSYPQVRPGINPEIVGGDSPPSPLPPPPPKNPDKAQVGAVAKVLIVEQGRPLTRSELFQRLKGAGINIYGKDPEMVLSTMMWRLKDDFVRLPRHGYWLKVLPYPPAEYLPGDKVQTELEDLVDAANVFGSETD